MNLVEWTDEAGTPHLSWLPEGAVDPEQGIPHDPPDMDGLELTQAQKRALYAALVRERVVTWRLEEQLREGVERAVRTAAGILPTPRLVSQVMALYAKRKVVKPLSTRFDLDKVLDRMEMSDEQRRCIAEIFAGARIVTLADVENAPARTGHICGVDIYQLVAHILAWA